MRVLVIGGTLFTGREIVARLARRGHDVTVLHRHGHHDLGPDIRNIQADRGDVDRVGPILQAERFDAVFDLAYDAQKGTTPEQVQAVARACTENLQRYIFMSSVAAYGPGLNHREDDPLVPDTSHHSYACHKAGAERQLFRMHDDTGFPATTIRPSFIYGPRQPYYREQFFFDRLLDRRPIILPDGGDAATSWAFVSDVAEVCVRALDVSEAAGQAFNIAHTEQTSQREFVELLAKVAGVTPQLVSVPRTTIQAEGGQLAGSPLYFGEFLDLPPHTVDVTKIARLLSVSPTPFADGLRAAFDWYRDQPRRDVDYSFEDRLLARNS